MEKQERPPEISWTLQVRYKPDGAWSAHTSGLWPLEKAVAFQSERQATYPRLQYRLIRVTTTFVVQEV